MIKTKVIRIEENCSIEVLRAALEEPAKALREGKTVAFPTETVYGLGANALSDESVAKIYKAKGRPSDNPLIVHIGNWEELNALVEEIPEKGRMLIDALWPGPLTMIFKKSAKVPEGVTPGLDTVAVRMPAHPIALNLIQMAGVPVAAPSANLSGKPSPTIGEHVIEDLSGKVDYIIVSGNAEVGLESTVLDLTGDVPMILRPGGATKEELEAVVGFIELDPALESKSDVHKPKSPGMKYTHYSPKAEVQVVSGELTKVVELIKTLSKERSDNGAVVGIMCSDETVSKYDESADGFKVKISLGSRAELKTVGSSLFRVLREFDEHGVDIILAEAYPDDGLGKAIMNRLNKAAGFNIIVIGK